MLSNLESNSFQYLYIIALQPYSVIIDSSTISYAGCWAAKEDVTLTTSGLVVTALKLLSALPFALPAALAGKFKPLPRLSRSITVVNLYIPEGIGIRLLLFLATVDTSCWLFYLRLLQKKVMTIHQHVDEGTKNRHHSSENAVHAD